MAQPTLLGLLLPFLFFPNSATQEPEPDSPQPATVRATQRDVERNFELSGRLIPSNAQELALWPDTFQGPFRLAEVVQHGTYLNAGDLIARFESRDYRERVADAERALTSARLALQGRVERAKVTKEEEQDAHFDARLAAERARIAFEGWTSVELDLKRRADSLSAQYTQHNIDDQVDELKQLEAMYSDDELVEATEEIVLSRSRRDLARSRFSQLMSEDRRIYDANFRTPQATEDHQRALERADAKLARLAVHQAAAARERTNALDNAEVEVEKKRLALSRLRADESLFELRAQQPCLLLHGGANDYKPGGKRPDHKRGSAMGLRTPLFTVADPAGLAVAVSLDQRQRVELSPRSGVRVTIDGRDDEIVGTLIFQDFPGPDGSFAGSIALQNVGTGVVAGMTAKVTVSSETLTAVVLLPRTAVSGTGTEAHCWSLDAKTGEYRRTSLELGPIDGDEIVVRGAIEAGAKVLVAGGGK
ncbi:MAG: hypothetical protein ACI835_005812 [Planctomycetota bacterium]|jgi:hypothetical protein